MRATAKTIVEKHATAAQGATTVGGSAPEGSACVFPFIYNDVSYSECTTEGNSGVRWCSTDPVYTRSWGNCRCAAPSGAADCSNLADGSPCVAAAGSSGNDACHAGVCESTSWQRMDGRDCSKTFPADRSLTTLAAAEAACTSHRNCGGIADENWYAHRPTRSASAWLPTERSSMLQQRRGGWQLQALPRREDCARGAELHVARQRRRRPLMVL